MAGAGIAYGRILNTHFCPAGQQYLYFLADARAALDMGVANFIEKDWTCAEDLARLPALLPLLLKVSLFDLLLQHDSRSLVLASAVP